MFHDNASIKENSNHSATGNLEQQIADLKKENKEPKTTVENQNRGLLNVSRRQTLVGLLDGGILLEAAGPASTKSNKGNGSSPFSKMGHDHSGNYLGEGEPVSRIDVTDLNTDYLSVTGPVVTSSKYSTIQAALDAATGGLLLINDTKTEEGIELAPKHSGTMIWCVGGHSIHQPANPTPGTPVIGRDKSLPEDSPVFDVRFIDLHISNPALSDADIKNEDTLPGPDRTSGFEWQSGAPSNYARRFEFVRPKINHVNGYGIGCSFTANEFTVRGGHITNVAYDAYYTKTYDDATTIFKECFAADTGRHNFAVAGNANDAAIHISGVGRRAYTAGIDIENGQNAHIDATIHESGRATSITGNNSDLHSGIYVANPSGPPTGRIKVINPQGCAAVLKPGGKDFSIVVEHDSPSHPNNLADVKLDRLDVADKTTAGDITCNINGGGTSGGSIQVYETSNARIEATVANVSGPAVVFSDGKSNSLDLTYENICTAGTNNTTPDAVILDADGAATGVFHTGPVRDNVIDVAGDSGNVQNSVSGSGDVDYVVVRGNVRTGYTATSATTGLGANSDTSDLIS